MKTFTPSEQLEVVNKILAIEELIRQGNATLVDEVELDMLKESLRINVSKERFIAMGLKLIEGGRSGNDSEKGEAA